LTLLKSYSIIIEILKKIMEERTLDIFRQLSNVLQKLGWEETDNIEVNIGGVAVTGTATNPDANPKWAKPYGTTTYQNDAFIVIKNATRNPVVSSKAPENE
jgi:hypothetical protein